MMRIRLLCLLAVCFVLAACDTFPKLQFTKTEYVFVKPADTLVQDCPQAVPPEPDAYVALTPKQREGVLTDLSLEQMDIIQKCNKQWAALRAWNERQEKIYSGQK